jgi:hypothetical protein
MIVSRRGRAIGALVLAAAALTIIGCQNGAGTPAPTASTYKDYLYMTDTYSGKVYAYDPASHAAFSQSVTATKQDASGSISFHSGIGYVAVGANGGEGVYYFDPSATNPTCSKIPGTFAAQYLAFSGPTAAFASSSDYSGQTSGLYYFNSSNPSSGCTQVSAAGSEYFQDVIVGPDSYIYVADNANEKVLRIDPTSRTVLATISTSAGGTTGLATGTLGAGAGAASGVFVANTGGYDADFKPLPGSIDFIPAGAADRSQATPISSETSTGGSIYPARLVQLSNGNLIATGYDHTYLVAFSGATATVTELKDRNDASFGSLDIAYKDGLAYIPYSVEASTAQFTNYLYVLDSTGAQESYSPVSVMTSSDSITNIAFYE